MKWSIQGQKLPVHRSPLSCLDSSSFCVNSSHHLRRKLSPDETDMLDQQFHFQHFPTEHLTKNRLEYAIKWTLNEIPSHFNLWRCQKWNIIRFFTIPRSLSVRVQMKTRNAISTCLSSHFYGSSFLHASKFLFSSTFHHRLFTFHRKTSNSPSKHQTRFMLYNSFGRKLR